MSVPTPAIYYAEVVPQQYAVAMSGLDATILAQAVLAATFEIDGERHGLQANGAELVYVPGGVEVPDMLVRMSHADWAVGVEHGATEAMIDYIQRRKVQVVKSLKGTVTLELERSDGTILTSSTTFGQLAEPAVTLMMTTDDYAAMLRGELNGQMAFMMGRLKFEGSLPLLMAIGALAGS
ncbi:MAG: hypothetical protein Fur005_10460 [Roseiflexaceae bacterium]